MKKKKDVKYKLHKVLDIGNCHAEVYVPERTPLEEEIRMKEIKEATAEFMRAVYIEREEGKEGLERRKAQEEEMYKFLYKMRMEEVENSLS